MKKNLLIITILIAIFTINVNASNTAPWGVSASPMDAYISDRSTLYNIMSSSNTTCKNYLESINYDLLGVISQNNSDGQAFIDLHYESNYDSANNTFKFRYYYVTGGSAPTYSFSNEFGLRFKMSGVNFKTYSINCSTGVPSMVDSGKLNGENYFQILEKRDVGYEFFTTLYQTNFGSLYSPSNTNSTDYNASWLLKGVYDNSLNEVKFIDDFVGSDYYSNNILVGAGIPLLPFYSVLSQDYSGVDIPYTEDYQYIYLPRGSILYFTPKTELDADMDKRIFVKPVIVDSTLLEKYADILKATDFKLGAYPNYNDLSTHTDYSYYWNNNYNDFMTFETEHLETSSSMYSLIYTNTMDVSFAQRVNQCIVYYNPKFWNVSTYNRETQQSNITISGVNGTVNYEKGDLNSNYSQVSSNTNIQNKPEYGNSGSHIDDTVNDSFLGSLLDNISGIGEFLDSVSDGIGTLTSSISSLITLAFSTLNALPTPISSVLYLCFICTIIAIILKIFL